MRMHVLVQKDVGSRWLNRFVVLILVAIIAIQISTYLKPKNDVAGEEARAAAVSEGMRSQHERELGLLAAKRIQEKAEADTQLEGLSRKISELQSDWPLPRRSGFRRKRKRIRSSRGSHGKSASFRARATGSWPNWPLLWSSRSKRATGKWPSTPSGWGGWRTRSPNQSETRLSRMVGRSRFRV